MRTSRTALTYVGGLIALYLAVAYASGTATDLKAGQSAGSGLIATLQGR
jgi:hypothetical protein